MGGGAWGEAGLGPRGPPPTVCLGVPREAVLLGRGLVGRAPQGWTSSVVSGCGRGAQPGPSLPFRPQSSPRLLPLLLRVGLSRGGGPGPGPAGGAELPGGGREVGTWRLQPSLARLVVGGLEGDSLGAQSRAELGPAARRAAGLSLRYCKLAGRGGGSVPAAGRSGKGSRRPRAGGRARPLPVSSCPGLGLRRFLGPEPWLEPGSPGLGHSWSSLGLCSGTAFGVPHGTAAWDGESTSPRSQVAGPRPQSRPGQNPELRSLNHCCLL